MFIRGTFLCISLIMLLAIAIPFTNVQADEIEPIQEPQENKKWVDDPEATPFPQIRSTSTPTPPATPKSSPGFMPTSPVLDNFNRATLGSNWSGATSFYAINANQLDVTNSSEASLFWNVSSFGADQEAYVTLSQIEPSPTGSTEIALILKAQTITGGADSFIEVLYNPAGQFIQVWTSSGGLWVQHGANISSSFSNGDILSAVANIYGQVSVYKNDTHIGARDISSWPHYANTGYIGVFNLNASNTLFDNFGGGNVGPFPSPTPTQPPCYDPMTCTTVSSYRALWYCDIPVCQTTPTPAPWRGTVVSWPSAAAFSNNARTADQSRTVYSNTGQLLYPYMKEWADGCQIYVNSGTVVIIEWHRGTDVWEEFTLEPGQTHTIDLDLPADADQDGAMIEGPNESWNGFSVTITNCAPVGPTAIQLQSLQASSSGSMLPLFQITILVSLPVTILLLNSMQKEEPS